MAWVAGRPVYADAKRKIADAAKEYDPHAWQPANTPAKKLFRCIECLRDLESLLLDAGRAKSKDKLRRKLKILHTPLHSLVEAARDLANDLENNPETVGMLPENARQLIPKIRSQLVQISTIEKGGALSTIRDKISAHIDKDLTLEQMHHLLNHAKPAQVGLWVHTCISVLSDFIKLPVYFWSCHPNGNGCVRIMFREPFVVTLELDSDDNATRLIDVHMIPSPPRYELFLLFQKIVRRSEWMFSSSDARITSFSEDQDHDTWAKSLDWLPLMSGLSPGKVKNSFTEKVVAIDKSYLLVPAQKTFLVKGNAQTIPDIQKLLS